MAHPPPPRSCPQGPSPRGWHYWGLLLQCPRKWHLTHDTGFRPVETRQSLRRGLLVHAGLAALLVGKDFSLAIREAGRWLDNPSGDGHRYLDDERVAIQVVAKYASFWKRIGRPKTLATEFEVEVRLGGVRYSCRFDEVARTRVYPVMLIEHKTGSGERRGEPTRTYAHDGQLVGQVAVWNEWTRLVREGLRKRPAWLSEPRPVSQVWLDYVPIQGDDFTMGSVPVSSHMIRHHLDSIRWAASQLARFRLTHEWPLTWNDCTDKYGRCDFDYYCHEGSSDGLIRVRGVKEKGTWT